METLVTAGLTIADECTGGGRLSTGVSDFRCGGRASTTGVDFGTEIGALDTAAFLLTSAPSSS